MEECTGKSTSCELRIIEAMRIDTGDEATREHYAGLYARPGASHGGGDSNHSIRSLEV